MSEMINNFFLKNDDTGVIYLKSTRLIFSEELNEREKKAIFYIKDIFELSLINSDNKVNNIGDYKPGQEALGILEILVDNTLNPYIKAYLLDILQSNKKNKFANAKSAIESYFKICESHNDLSSKRDYYIRILHILKGLGKGNKPIISTFFEIIKQDILNADLFEECYFVTELIKEITMLNVESIQYEPFIIKIENVLGQLLSQGEFKHYRECHQVLSLLKREDSKTHLTEVARGYIMEANEYELIENASQHIIAEMYKKGIRKFKLLNIKNKETRSLGKKLIEIQKKASNQLSSLVIMAPISLSHGIEIEMPDFKNIYQAVYWFIGLDLPLKSKFVKNLEKNKKEFFHLQHFNSIMTDSQGNTIGVSDDHEKLIYREASLMRENICKMILMPSYDKLCDSFAISELEVYELISQSKFIPQERLGIYTHGLYNGFCGNFVVAVHLLLPQIENGIRFILNNRGIITTKLVGEVQTENGLTTNLNSLKNILHEDLIFDLEGLLNEPFGDNFRNDVSHGLCETSKLNSAPGFYTWWIALKLSLEIEQYMLDK